MQLKDVSQDEMPVHTLGTGMNLYSLKKCQGGFLCQTIQKSFGRKNP